MSYNQWDHVQGAIFLISMLPRWIRDSVSVQLQLQVTRELIKCVGAFCSCVEVCKNVVLASNKVRACEIRRLKVGLLRYSLPRLY